MKAHGMLYSADMVLADLRGDKLQTRRPVTFENTITKPHVNREEFSDLIFEDIKTTGYDEHNIIAMPVRSRLRFEEVLLSPRVQPGDTLWFKETFADEDGILYFKATPNIHRVYTMDQDCLETDSPYEGKWKPSIHMPQWASRISHVVSTVRLQRLQDISEEDSLKEGIQFKTSPEGTGLISIGEKTSPFDYVKPRQKGETHQDVIARAFKPIPHFAALWDAKYGGGPHAWKNNGLVWIYDYEVKP